MTVGARSRLMNTSIIMSDPKIFCAVQMDIKTRTFLQCLFWTNLFRSGKLHFGRMTMHGACKQAKQGVTRAHSLHSRSAH